MLGASFSAFLNNTPIVVMLLPILIGVSLRAKQSTSGILLPMGLATLLGGMATTIGTSTNLLVVSIAADLGMRRFDMFDFALPVVCAGALGMLYLWLVAPRLLPERKALLSDTSPRVFDAVLHITDESYAHERKLEEVLEKAGEGMRIISIKRGEASLWHAGRTRSYSPGTDCKSATRRRDSRNTNRHWAPHSIAPVMTNR